MGTPTKTSVYAYLETGLAGITVAAGYKSTVVTVEKVIKPADDIGATLRPWIGFKPGLGRERFEAQGPYHLWVTFPLYIGAHVYATTEDGVDQAIVNLQDDVIAFMFSDATMGGETVDVRLVDGWDDIGDPDRAMTDGETGYSGTFDQQWEVTYERTTEST